MEKKIYLVLFALFIFLLIILLYKKPGKITTLSGIGSVISAIIVLFFVRKKKSKLQSNVLRRISDEK